MALLGIFIEQLGNENVLSFTEIMKSGMIWLVAVIFVLAILSLLMGLVPQFADVIWVYLGFLLFMTYLGKLLNLPKWLENLSIYSQIPQITSGENESSNSQLDINISSCINSDWL